MGCLQFYPMYTVYQFGCGIAKIVGPKKQAFCPKINMLKENFDTNYFEPLYSLKVCQIF